MLNRCRPRCHAYVVNVTISVINHRGAEPLRTHIRQVDGTTTAAKAGRRTEALKTET